MRITPDEVHLSDSENYDKIYFMGSKYSKSPRFYNALNVPHSTFGTPPNDIHKHKRGLLNPFFSRKTVLDLEEVVQDKARKLVQLMQKAIDEDRPCDLHHAFRAVSVDVITDYAFGESYDLLDSPDLGSYIFRMVRGIGPAMWAFQQFPSLQALALKMPPWLAPKLSEPLGQVIGLQMTCVKQIEAVRSHIKNGTLNKSDRPTIFNDLLDAEKQDGWAVPSTWELKDEVYSVLAAAADTTGNAMTIAAYNVLKDPSISSKLRTELLQAFPNTNTGLKFVDLERLPYLTGVVKEGVRLSFGVIGRLPRIVPEGGVSFHGHYVPEGYAVGMSSWLMHRNPEVFSDPMKFDPDRWTDPATYRKLDSNIVAFGKGSRQCVGMPLAYAEVYVTIGTLFRTFDSLSIFETTDQDLDYDDFFSSYHVYGKKWFKAVGSHSDKGSE